METNTLPSLFISYSYQDKEFADRIASDIKEQDINVTYDSTLLKPGDAIRETLLNSIREVDIVLVIITPNSISSSNVMNELGIAQESIRNSEGKKLLLPLICGDVRLPYNVADVSAIYMKEPRIESKEYPKALADILQAIKDFPYNYQIETEQLKSNIQNNTNDSQPSNKQTDNSNAGNYRTKYWLLKLNPDTWAIDDFKAGENTFVNTHYFGEKRPEYKLFKEIKKGDLILGFATGDFQSIVCQMQVTKPVGPDTAQGEGFEMVIKKVLSPRISLEVFSNMIPETLSQLKENKRPPELFFNLTERIYKIIFFFKSGPLETEYKNSYQPFYLTEGNHQTTEDQLDFENDINSFASVIALKKVNPPLAIGLFGNWGSGKSFFMEKLLERIEEISKSKDEEYIQNVVQVKFNSWHYSDTNLWASLITEIFDSLNKYAKKEKQEPEISKLKKTLTTTSIEREVIDEKRKTLEVSVKALELDQAQKRKRLEDISGIGLLKYILRDKRINKDLSELNNENIETVISDVNKVEEYIKEVKDTGNKSVFFFKEFFNLQGWRWPLVIAVAIVVAVAVPLLKNIFPAEWQNFTWQLRTYAALIAGFVANMVATIKPYKENINDALERLQSVKKTLESRAQVISPQLTEKERELALLKSSLANIDVEIEKTKESINEILSGRRLQKFINDRTKDENYSNALGVISRIRKDFVTLDMLLREQHSLTDEEKGALFNPENVQLKIDRVVLYIDDLDRCNEDVVVKVLEAIHLLLAFKLFVVIVGVDPRWLNNALSEKYKTLFGNNATVNKSADDKQKNNIGGGEKEEALFNSLSGAATSYDYLEKIFQIPFALKLINRTGREKLIKYLIREEMADDKNVTGRQIYASVTEEAHATDAVSASLNEPLDKKRNNENNAETEQEKPSKARKVKERLIFTTAELAYMQKISSLFGQTPRTINRYVNIYRIIKAHGSLKIVGDFSKEEFMPIMFVLGVIVGSSAFAEEFIDGISKADDNNEFKEFIEKSKFPERLKALIKPLSSDIENILIEDFKRNIELISRFSFRTILK